MQPYTGHPVILCASAHILLPIEELRIDRPERHEEAFAIGIALRRQPGVDASNILVQNSIETPRPGLRYILLAQSRHQFGSLVSSQAAKWPAREIDVSVDDHSWYPFARKAGVNSLRRFAPSTN